MNQPDGDQAALLQAILDTSVAAVSVLDPEGRIVFANRKAEEILGLERREIVKRAYDTPAWKATAPDGGPWPDESQPFRIVMRTGEPVSDVRHAIEWPDGRRKLLSINGAPIKDEDGRITRLVFSVADITEQVAIEKRMRESQARLRQAQRLESVGRLAGGVAHDFNNLLTAIIGCAELIHPTLADRPCEQGLVGQIRDTAGRGAALTQQLLTFSSEHAVQAQVVDINKLIREAHDLLIRLIGEDIELMTDLDADLWPVEVDPGRFEQVVLNLVVNARDAMPSGGRLTITSSNTPGEGGGGDGVLVTVQDTGVGMDDDTLQLSFEPFFTTKQPGKGTGLGLSTCFGIIRQAGGTIDAESTPGEGTRYQIWLPRSPERRRRDVADRGDAALVAGRGTILVVEDDVVVRDVTRAMLERAGYDVLEAANGDAALDVFAGADRRIEMLVTDVVMPQMNGAELATRLLRHDPDLKILFVSGYSTDVGPLRHLLDDGIHLVQKPFSASQLTQKVREVLEG